MPYRDGDLEPTVERAPEVDAIAGDVPSEILRWRALALAGWAEALAARRPLRAPGDDEDPTVLRAELDRIHRSISWRVTKPLRATRRLIGVALRRT